jgi:Tfp pilus assembly protein PilO
VVNSTLLRRIAREHRHLAIPIVVLVAINAVLFAAFIFPLSRRVANVAERTQMAENELATARFAHKRVTDALNGKSQASQQLDRFYHSVLPANFVAARGLVNPRLQQMAQDARLTWTNTTFERVAERDHVLQQLRIHMTLTGNYDGIRAFIQRLEHSQEFLVINRIVLKESEVDNAPLALQVDLSTYYREPVR